MAEVTPGRRHTDTSQGRRAAGPTTTAELEAGRSAWSAGALDEGFGWLPGEAARSSAGGLGVRHPRLGDRAPAPPTKINKQDHRVPEGARRVTERMSDRHPRNKPLTCNNTPRVPEVPEIPYMRIQRARALRARGANFSKTPDIGHPRHPEARP